MESGYIDVDGLRAHLTMPATETPSGTAVLLLPMITGIGERVREFASLVADGTGSVALTWDPWHGRSSDDTPFAELAARHGRLEDEPALDEQRRLVGHLAAAHGAQRVAVIGWCLGGRFALLLGARAPRISGVVAYHPTLPAERPATHTADAVDEAHDVTAPVLIHYPGRDSLVPRKNFLLLQEALQDRDTDAVTITHIYPHAKHGFSDTARHGEQVNADAWAFSWPQTLAFLTHL